MVVRYKNGNTWENIPSILKLCTNNGYTVPMMYHMGIGWDMMVFLQKHKKRHAASELGFWKAGDGFPTGFDAEKRVAAKKMGCFRKPNKGCRTWVDIRSLPNME